MVLSPVMLAIALAIKIEDPGPALFIQKRVGQNKQYFKLHKFRSMKMCTPHDVPTHMLDNPDKYITRIGKFIRTHSLDELPQIWDIFIGNMSVVGPRPALWSQDLLISERDKYGANDVKPGLTGWAQINGRDELEIPQKARLDGEYCKNISFSMDVRCFLGSLHVLNGDDSVVEGGTKEMKKSHIGRHYTDGKSDSNIIGHIGFGAPVEVDTTTEKKVLITGVGSYIGESFKSYAGEHYPALKVDAVDMLDVSWREKDFSVYDIVYHVAGIAHSDVGNVDDAIKEKYYVVNTDLAVEVCEKAKAEGVKKFIFMSSMIVYGDSAPYGKSKMVGKHTVPAPANFYGDSKLQADVAVRDLADDRFKVIVLRPPMIYGKGSKGNYSTLAKIAKKVPVFPDVDNERSMLYIDNLCEFLCQIMLVKDAKENAVVLIPQNAEWTRTSEMVKNIGEVSGKNVRLLGIMKLAVLLGGKVPGKIGGLVNKAFGNSYYKHELSVYEGIKYQTTSLKDSIEKTEGISQKKLSNKVCIINCFDTYEHRVDLLYDYFKKQRLDVSVYTSDFRHFEKCQRTDNKEDYTLFHAIPYSKNMSVDRLRSHVMLAKDIFNAVETQDFDLLWVLVPPNSFVKEAARYKKNHKDVKLIFDLIDLWPETMPISKFKSLPPFTYWKNLRNNNLDAADEIVTECNLYHEKLLPCVQKKLHTIYLAREIKEYEPHLNLPEDKIALCYLGSINNIIDIPGIADLIRDIKKYKPVELHIIGDGEKRDELICASEEAGAEVIYHGKIYDTEKKQKIFDSCHYGLNFMKDSVFVGLTMKSMDYFEAGIPIINNIHGDTWDIVKNHHLGINYSGKLECTGVFSCDLTMRNNSRSFFCCNLSTEKFENEIDVVLHPDKYHGNAVNTIVFAGIVTYNPDLERLKENINAIRGQVKKIIIVDNGSSNIEEIKNLAGMEIEVIPNKSNLGIAAALNIAMTKAKEQGAGWVITLDQDSICTDDYVEKAAPFLSKHEIGQIVPVLYESQSGQCHCLGDKNNGKEYQYVHKSITSASITSILVWDAIGKFDEGMFIDYVDYDYALKLRLAGFRIVRLNTVYLDQQIGNSTNRKFGPLNIRVANHSAFRKYYISRNIIVFMRRYGKESRPFFEFLRLNKVIGLTLLYEDNKKEKMSAIVHGIHDGLKYDV